MPSKQLSDYYFKIYEQAHLAGLEAVRQEVLSRAERYPSSRGMDPLTSGYIPGEYCGCATVRVNGNSSFGRWAKKNQRWRVFDPPGVCLDDNLFIQSYQRQVAYADAFVRTLRNAGIDAWYTDRLD